MATNNSNMDKTIRVIICLLSLGHFCHHRLAQVNAMLKIGILTMIIKQTFQTHEAMTTTDNGDEMLKIQTQTQYVPCEMYPYVLYVQ